MNIVAEIREYGNYPAYNRSIVHTGKVSVLIDEDYYYPITYPAGMNLYQ